MELRINPEFQKLIPALKPEELQQLEANILADGCRNALVVWLKPAPKPGEHKCYAHDQSKCELIVGDGVWTCKHCDHNPELLEYILVDGHNRYAICKRHDLPFEVDVMHFESEAHLRIWMRNLALGQRNLERAWSIELALENKKDLLAIGRERQAHGNTAPGSNAFILKYKSDALPPHNTQVELAKAADVSTATIGRAERVRAAAPELWEQAKAGDITVTGAYKQLVRKEKEEKREAKRQHNRQLIETTEPERIAAVDAKFATIVIDPPWDWGDEGDQDQLGRARPDYATMSLAKLEALNVCKHADDNAHIYLWITNRSLPKGFSLLKTWGFRYITCITWVKPHFGMGNYFRGQTEHVLFGVRGSQPLKRKDAGTVFHAPRGDGGHSSKPTAFHDLVESCSPGPYLEMFSRLKRSGWATWGEGGYDYTA